MNSQISAVEYVNPPVHEVVVDLVFDGEISVDKLEPVVEKLGDVFAKPERVEATNFEIVASGGMAPQVAASSQLIGWKFEIAGFPRWVVRLQRERVTINMVRSEVWPEGQYIGWGLIEQRLHDLLPVVEPVYSGRSIRRAGLRYVNRLAIPHTDRLDDWLNIGSRAPSQLSQTEGLNLRQTWRSISGFDGLSVTVALSRVEIGDKLLAASCSGMLLDIDLYNGSQANAPTHEQVLSWYSRTHLAENMIFESCITERSRVAFVRRETNASK